MITKYKVGIPENPTLRDFIKFFSAIPATEWCVGTLENGAGQRCANGHLNAYYSGGSGHDWPTTSEVFDSRYPSYNGAPNIVQHNNANKTYGRYDGPIPKDPKKGIKTRVINYLKRCLKEQETKNNNDTLGTMQAKG